MNKSPIDIAALDEQALAIERAIQEAVAEEVQRHKLLGFPIVVCEGGEVRLIQPSDIEISSD